MALARTGTIQNGRLVHPILEDARSAAELVTIRGDYRDEHGNNRNRLRLWEKSDFKPRPDDILQERIYAIQWIIKDSIGSSRPEAFFAAVRDEDLVRERQIDTLVHESLSRWQDEGLVPDMPIEPGDETTRLFRERGWSYWHHLFTPRQLLFFSILKRVQSQHDPKIGYIDLCRLLDRSSRLPKWSKSNGSGGQPSNVFDNQALKTQVNFGTYASTNLLNLFVRTRARSPVRNAIVRCQDARNHSAESDIFVTDPPYADAINYHEITEFFIAWLRKSPPKPFDEWEWDSQRKSAIKGKGEEFRRDMVTAYSAMTKHMPDNGMQVVMFTHQDAGVWADLGSVLWAAGLRVTAAWNIVTEIAKTSGNGNYVQGTVCLVLRKRLKEANARRMEIEAEIEDAVRAQLDRLNALDEAWTAETLYTDGDLTLAAYAAALQVVTSYSTIDRQPLDRDLYRKLAKGERTMIRDLVDYAAQVANGMLVPTDFPRDMWRDLGAPERFYVRMLDMEAKGSAKVADFQNFAKSFAFGDYTSVMASTTANAAALAGAADLKGGKLGGEGFFATQLRQVLFAVWKTLEKGDPKLGVTTLRTEYAADYWQRRQKLIALAAYVAAKTKYTRPEESAAAYELAEALKLDKV
jgi:putative DNA methylase